MTIMQSEQLKLDQQEKGFSNLLENFDLNVTAQELEQHPDLQWGLLENRCNHYSELSGRMVKHTENLIVEARQQGEQVPLTKAFEGRVTHVDDLLILAQSAEIVAQSENGVVGLHINNRKNKGVHSDLVDQMSQEYVSNITADDQECSQQLDILSTISHVSSQQCGFYGEATRTRLTQIRKQARCKYLILAQDGARDSPCKRSQGKTIRLNQIKHQARCKSKNNLLMITGPRNGQVGGRILRLSQMKHQARSKGNSMATDGNEVHMEESLPCNTFKDNNEKEIAGQFLKKNIFQDSSPFVEGVPAYNFCGGATQSSVAADSGSEAQEEFIPVKRLRLTQLRREARLRDHYSAMQGLAGN